jgi:hypothetical protein
VRVGNPERKGQTAEWKRMKAIVEITPVYRERVKKIEGEVN